MWLFIYHTECPKYNNIIEHPKRSIKSIQFTKLNSNMLNYHTKMTLTELKRKTYEWKNLKSVKLSCFSFRVIEKLRNMFKGGFIHWNTDLLMRRIRFKIFYCNNNNHFFCEFCKTYQCG